MKLNKTFGRIATTLVATAMLASVAAVPAFAEPNPPITSGGTEDRPLTKIVITKQLVLPAGSVTPTKEFSFTIKPAEADETKDTIDVEGGTVGVRDGIGDTQGYSAGNVQISTDDDTNRVDGAGEYVGYDVVSDTVELTLPSGFQDAGVYKYAIDEVAIDDDDYKDETGSLTLYVVVERKEDAEIGSTKVTDYYISSAVVYDGDTKSETYTNWYKLGSGVTPETQVGSISVTKNITGTMASPNDLFTFTLAGMNADTDYYYTVGDGQPQLLPKNGQFQLKANQTAVITGLDLKKAYTVTETEDKGYTVKSITGDEGTDKEDNVASVTLTSEDKDKEITVLNERNAVSPTGLVMDIAPYALLVVVAAAGCFVFLRKRRED